MYLYILLLELYTLETQERLIENISLSTFCNKQTF